MGTDFDADIIRWKNAHGEHLDAEIVRWGDDGDSFVVLEVSHSNYRTRF